MALTGAAAKGTNSAQHATLGASVQPTAGQRKRPPSCLTPWAAGHAAAHRHVDLVRRRLALLSQAIVVHASTDRWSVLWLCESPPRVARWPWRRERVQHAPCNVHAHHRFSIAQKHGLMSQIFCMVLLRLIGKVNNNFAFFSVCAHVGSFSPFFDTDPLALVRCGGAITTRAGEDAGKKSCAVPYEACCFFGVN